MKSHRHRRNGFTIVELLIVIVVIAILAAISIVSYNGIQQRSNNTSTVATASQSLKLIQLYMAANGAYPQSSTSCLTALCTDQSATERSQGSQIRTSLASVGTIPEDTPKAGNYHGVFYNPRAATATLNGDSTQAIVLMMYWLRGQSQDCGMSGIVRQTTGETWVTTSDKYSYNNSSENATQCWIAITNPK